MKKNSLRRPIRSAATGLLGMLMPVALSTTAQTPPPLPPMPANIESAAATAVAHTQPAAYRTGLVPQVQAPAAGFNVANIESMAQQLTYGERVPGMAVAIVQGGRILSARGYGVTDVNNPLPVDAHTVFRLASLSKAFAGTMAGLLVNDGTLRWDSKVTDYVPGFRLNSPEATDRLTVADVLSHRVGLPYNAYDRDIEGNAEYYALTQKLANTSLKCLPGDCYAYQNVAFSLIGDVVYAASGSFYEQSVERRIFKPLGMNDASLGLAGIQASSRWARPHVRSRNGWVSLTPKPTYYRVAPAAGVNASASDMAQWLLAHTGHRPDVLPAPLLATLHSSLINTPARCVRAGAASACTRPATHWAGAPSTTPATTWCSMPVPYRATAAWSRWCRNAISASPSCGMARAACPAACCRPCSIPRSVCRHSAGWMWTPTSAATT